MLGLLDKLDKRNEKDLEGPGMSHSPAWNIPRVAARLVTPTSRCVANGLNQAAVSGMKGN